MGVIQHLEGLRFENSMELTWVNQKESADYPCLRPGLPCCHGKGGMRFRAESTAQLCNRFSSIESSEESYLVLGRISNEGEALKLFVDERTEEIGWYLSLAMGGKNEVVVHGDAFERRGLIGRMAPQEVSHTYPHVCSTNPNI